MSHKDKAMRDMRNSNCTMGGCTILFSGDFRQILPVITSGTRADEINTSLKRSYIRIVSSSKDNRQFSIDLLQIGNGVNDFITL